MTWSNQEIIELVFVPIYFILFCVALFAFIRHSHNKTVTFGLLFLFPLIRCVGNAILVAAYQMIKKPNPNMNTLQSLFTAGFILELAGFGILLGAGLNLTNRAILYDPKKQKRQAQQGQQQQSSNGGLIGKLISTPPRLLQLINLVASILLIVGISNSTDAFSINSTDHKVDSLATVGCILLLVDTVLLLLFALYNLFIKGPITPSARIILIFVIAACFPMIARMAWSTYKVSSSNLANVNVWAQLVLQYLAECLATLIFIALSFVLAKRGGDSDLDERREYNDRLENNNNQHQQFSQTYQQSSPDYKESSNKNNTYPPMAAQGYNAA